MSTTHQLDPPEAPYVDITGGRAARTDSALTHRNGTIATRLGLGLSTETLSLVSRKAMEFVEQRFGGPYEGAPWQALAARREMLLVLAGGLFGSSIEAALPDCDVALQQEIAELVAEEISTPRPEWVGAPAARLRLDPDCWSLRPLEGTRLLLHLSTLAEAARLQDDALIASDSIEIAGGTDDLQIELGAAMAAP